MSDPTTIAAGKVVTIHYTLTGDDGQVIDSSSGQEPLDYLHGAANIVPGLERELEGKAVGDEVQVKVEPEHGYGVRDDGAVVEVERNAFPADADIAAGITFQAVDQNEQPMIGTIVSVEGNEVKVDFNHPLAGLNLNFEVKIEAVREATAQEQEHGHAHGPGGHDH